MGRSPWLQRSYIWQLIMELLRQLQSADSTVSIVAEWLDGTYGIVGLVPSYQGLKENFQNQ